MNFDISRRIKSLCRIQNDFFVDECKQMGLVFFFFLQRFEKQILLSIRMQRNARLHRWIAERYEGIARGLNCLVEGLKGFWYFILIVDD